MDKFVREENLKLYRRLLSEAPAEEQRQILVMLVKCLVRQQIQDAPSRLN